MRAGTLWDCLSPGQRRKTAGWDRNLYRPLSRAEIVRLEGQGNTARDWSAVWITPECDLRFIRGCRFLGELYIGGLSGGLLEREGFRLESGLFDSVLCNCILDQNVAVHSVRRLENYLIYRDTVLFCVDEMRCDEQATFGWGVAAGGRERIWIGTANENGKRAIAAFEGMLPTDAALWSRRRSGALQREFERMVEGDFPYRDESGRSALGEAGPGSWIQSARVIRNVAAAPGTVILASNYLEDLSINSSLEEPTVLGEGVILRHGCVGKGCRVLSASQAIRFVLGDFSELRNGARILDCFLGDHSSIACCEMVHNYVGPLHGQHHNNSFLIASSLEGQSNLAAGVVLGSNHNSRRADGEFLAERGFWAGLGSLFRHNSRCAAFTLAASGNYTSELNIPYPFSLVSQSGETVSVRPAYWFKRNFYALERNRYKFRCRSAANRRLYLTSDYLAPDTAFGMYRAVERLERLLGETGNPDPGPEELWDPGLVRRGAARVVRPGEAVRLYREMICYFIGRTVLKFLQEAEYPPLEAVPDVLSRFEPCGEPWVSLGGQLFRTGRIDEICRDLESGVLNSWEGLHARYRDAAGAYVEESLRAALWLREQLRAVQSPEAGTILADWTSLFRFCREWAVRIEQACRENRKRDLEDSYRDLTCWDPIDRAEVLGSLEEDDFLVSLRGETEIFCHSLDRYL